MEQQAIQLFENTQVRMVWNEEEEKYYFSIADIVQILTDSEDVKQYIKRMRTRDPELNGKWGTICTPVRLGVVAFIVLSSLAKRKASQPPLSKRRRVVCK